jgi:membrane-associated protease RseP (regulator of RpoE activity)
MVLHVKRLQSHFFSLRHNATCEISSETGLPVEFDCLFQVSCASFQSLFFPTAFAQSNTYALGGLPVSAVTFGQPAALAGLQKGDVIVSVNGTSLRATEHSKAIHVLNAAFSSSSTHVSLDVVRRVEAARTTLCYVTV